MRDPARFAGLALLILLALPLLRHWPDLGSWSVWLAGAIPLVIAAIAQAQIVLAGGQGLSAGATALLVAAVLGAHMGDSSASMASWSLAGLLLGGAIGTANGLLIGYLRLPSTAVTLATSFVVGGATLAVTGLAPLPSPERFRDLVTGEAWPGMPLPIALAVLLLAIAAALDHSTIGRRIRAAGAGGWRQVACRRSDAVALAYGIAGIGYGASGVFMAGAIGISDPITGGPSLLEIYAAVALGGSLPYLSQGSSLGAAFGGLAISALGYVALSFDLPDYATPVATGLLLLACLFWAGRNAPAQTAMDPPAAQALGFPIALFGLPLLIAAVAMSGWLGPLLHLDPVLLLLAGMLALAQGLVVATGHLDLSLAAIMAAAGLATVAFTQGADPALGWAVPLILGLGITGGAASGALGRYLRGPRVLVTLAVAGLLGALSIHLSLAMPNGFAPPALMRFLNRTGAGPAPAVLVLGPLLLLGLLLLATAPARCWLRQFGQEPDPPAGGKAAPLVHALAGLLAAGIGVLLAGYGGQTPLAAAEPFTLPSLLAIETAGLAIGRRGGNPVMLLFAVPMVLILDTLLVGLGLEYPTRVIAMGTLLLGAVILRGLGWRTVDGPPYHR
jgi:ribose transport system permease protein